VDRQRNFIICIQDSYYEIHGLFNNQRELGAYGSLWQAEHDDDPRWQSIDLDEPHRPPALNNRGAGAFEEEEERREQQHHGGYKQQMN
jgi:hypothetical protein